MNVVETIAPVFGAGAGLIAVVYYVVAKSRRGRDARQADQH